MIDAPTHRIHRVTMSGSHSHRAQTCMSRRQAFFSLHKQESFHALEHLRYSLGGYRPSQTVILTLNHL
jgi:hypothetical protein